MNNSFNSSLIEGINVDIVIIPTTTLGLVLNLFLTIVISADKYFHKRTYHLIRISFISDIISNLIYTVNFGITTDFNINYQFARLLCQITFYFTTSLYGISMLTLCLIAIDRYLVITKPNTRLNNTIQQHFILIGQIIIWTISLLTPIPIFDIVGIYQNQTDACDFPIITSKTSIYLCSITIMLYILPTIVIVFMYGKVILYTKKYIRPVNFNHEQEIDHIARRKFVKMLITITSFNVFLSWPFFATLVGIAITRTPIQYLRKVNQTHYALASASFSVTIAITIANPILYLKFDKHIRRASLLLLKLLVSRNRHSHSRIVILRAK
ncbi:Galanin receptor type 2 [Trichoplax sp. H2]|nr:Galanin receptor type 2 [Trichoplax sp. H2]|eukprot:RDD37842.1 Galanin receptor type 2 [Trichoplax sp. H2]